MGLYCRVGGATSARPNFSSTSCSTSSFGSGAGLLLDNPLVERLVRNPFVATLVVKSIVEWFVGGLVVTLLCPNLDFRHELIPRPSLSSSPRRKPIFLHLLLLRTVQAERLLAVNLVRAIVFPDFGQANRSYLSAPD